MFVNKNFKPAAFQDANKEESEEDEIIQKPPDFDKRSVYLSDVTICLSSLQSTLDIIHPSSLSDYYDFALEEKVLGLGQPALMQTAANLMYS